MRFRREVGRDAAWVEAGPWGEVGDKDAGRWHGNRPYDDSHASFCYHPGISLRISTGSLPG